MWRYMSTGEKAQKTLVPEDPRKDALPNSAIAIVRDIMKGGQTY
jgi:hypothetical protein